MSQLVWVLIVVGSVNGGSHASQLGPYVDLASCQRVQQSAPFTTGRGPWLVTQCVQVRQP